MILAMRNARRSVLAGLPALILALFQARRGLRMLPGLLLVLGTGLAGGHSLFAAEPRRPDMSVRATEPATPQILPLSQIKPGMEGVGYTIFSGEQIQKFGVHVIGVLPNLLGPKQDIVLVRLVGADVDQTGVVAGMSGSPVYIGGKLAGAISLKFGVFTKEAIAGMTPIEEILAAGQAGPGRGRPVAAGGAVTNPGPELQRAGGEPAAGGSLEYPVPSELARQAGLTAAAGGGTGAFLAPIETPLVFSGFYPEALGPFADQFRAYGMVATEGGTAPAAPGDAALQPGDMAAIVLVRGDLSISAGCTVTARIGDRVYLCGHPLFRFGQVALPLARGHVLTTLSSSLASTKIMNTGGVIGTVTEDRATAVLGRLGASPAMIPVELAVKTRTTEKHFRFELIESRKLTPLLVALATFNGLSGSPAYSEGATFLLHGKIEIAGHAPVRLDNMFAPSDSPLPDAFPVALDVENVFAQIFNNPYERPHISQIQLRVESIPERRWARIENAWIEKSEVRPGESVTVKVLLHPYRGAPYIQEVPIRIPEQVSRGQLEVLVSDGVALDQMEQLSLASGQGQLAGLGELIRLLNRGRRNDRLYVALLQPSPTLLVEDKRLPNAPISEINVLEQQRSPGSTRLLGQSEAGEWSVPMQRVITGRQYLTITVK
jgi:hypothetical protein